MPTVTTALVQGIRLYLDAMLTQSFDDASVPAVGLNQYYNDAANPSAALVQRFGDGLLSTVAMEQKYHLMFETLNGLDQPFTICQLEVKTALDQLYDLRLLDPVTAALKQMYGMLGDPARLSSGGVSVIADDQTVTPSQVSVDFSQGGYSMKCEIHLPSQAEWNSIQRLGDLFIYDGTETYEFFIESKQRTRSRPGKDSYQADYVLIGRSKAASLDVPYAVPETNDWPDGAMASTIAAELAGDITIDWQIIDWWIPGNRFFQNDETPISALRKLIADRGIMQSDPDGTLVVKKLDETAPADYATATADYALTDEYDFTTASEQPDIRPGYNFVLISDQLAANDGHDMEYEDVSDTEKIVRCYKVPWSDTFGLSTSGGDWVNINDLGTETEDITEKVAIVDGIGSTSKPIYAQVGLTWLQTQLGAVTFSEDGQLIADVLENSIAEFTYTTKCRKWAVSSNKIESVQFFITE